MAISINLPTAEEEDLQRRFTVNKNYLQAVAGFIATSYGRREKLYVGLRSAVEAMAPYQRIQRGQADLDEVRRFLNLAWTSEIQLHLPAIMGNSSMLAFANTWAPVHAYYAVYGTLQAWFTANGMTGVSDDHTATLRTIAKQIDQRDLFPEPWNLLAVGCPMRKERIHLNDHGEDCTSHIEVLSMPTPFGHDPEFWARMGTWLRSTRQARLLAREEQWKKKEKKLRIAPSARKQIALSVAPTSIFDCFWRMRIRSNYGTIDPYLVNRISEADHEVYNNSLCTVILNRLNMRDLTIAQPSRRGRLPKGFARSSGVATVAQTAAGAAAWPTDDVLSR